WESASMAATAACQPPSKEKGGAKPRPSFFCSAAWSSDRLVLFYAGGSRDLRSEVGLLLLNALAQLEADETLECDRRTGFLAGGGDDVGDRGLVVHDEQLADQSAFLAELGEAAFDHLLDDVGG